MTYNLSERRVKIRTYGFIIHTMTHLCCSPFPLSTKTPVHSLPNWAVQIQSHCQSLWDMYLMHILLYQRGIRYGYVSRLVVPVHCGNRVKFYLIFLYVWCKWISMVWFDYYNLLEISAEIKQKLIDYWFPRILVPTHRWGGNADYYLMQN